MRNSASYEKRMMDIINLSYQILCGKVEEGNIKLPNEASFQLQLGVILKMVGQLYEYNPKDCFTIELETPQSIESTTQKTSRKSRCDIELNFYHGSICKAKSFIELKHFRKDPNEASTDNRYSLFVDLKKLESYKKAESVSAICCEIVYTNNENYTKSGNSKIDIGNEVTSSKNIIYTSGKQVTLDNQYTFQWDSLENGIHFLKIIF